MDEQGYPRDVAPSERHPNQPQLMRPWTPEEAIEKARLGGRNGKGKKKPFTLRGKVKRILNQLVQHNGETVNRAHMVALALVKAAEQGDIRAIETLGNWTDGPLAQPSKVTTTETRTLRVVGESEQRTLSVSVSDNTSYVADQSASLPTPGPIIDNPPVAQGEGHNL